MIGLARVLLQISRDRGEHLTGLASENVAEREALAHEALTTSLKLAATVVAAAVPHTSKAMAKCVTLETGSVKGLFPQVPRADHKAGVWTDR